MYEFHVWNLSTPLKNLEPWTLNVHEVWIMLWFVQTGNSSEIYELLINRTFSIYTSEVFEDKLYPIIFIIT